MNASIASGSRRFALQLAALTFATVIGGYLLSAYFGVQSPELLSPFTILFLAAACAGATLLLTAYLLWLAVTGESHPWRRIAQLPVRSPDFLARRLVPILLTLAFLGSFGTYKSLIAYIHPFAWDAAFSDVDRLIFGTDPWRLTHAIIGRAGTRVLDLVYGLWFPAWLFTLIYFGCFASEARQRRFVIAFIAVWMVEGFVLATIFSSAGPCYLQMIHHPYAVRYQGLFPMDAPGANAAQAMLATAYRGGDIGAFKGISAMPSVHVGVAFLLVLASRGWWRVAALLFFAMIFVASVHLGWHYASDGFAASFVTAVCWQLAKHGRPASRAMTPTVDHAAGRPVSIS